MGFMGFMEQKAVLGLGTGLDDTLQTSKTTGASTLLSKSLEGRISNGSKVFLTIPPHPVQDLPESWLKLRPLYLDDAHKY